MKKKVLIVNNNFNSGGVQKALINLLEEIKDKYEVTLYIFSNSGEYKNTLPQGVKIIEGNKFVKLLGISQKEALNVGYFSYITRGSSVLWSKLFNNSLPFNILLKTQKKIKNFDIAISYLHSSPQNSFYGGCNEFVLNRVIAKEKIAFVHCDYSNYGGDTIKNGETYGRFDRIATVSKGCKMNFLKKLPHLSEKTFVVRNFNNHNDIVLNSNNLPIEYDLNKVLNIVTVARLSREKGLISVIEVIKELVDKNYDIVWHLIGAGSQEMEINELICKYSLDKNIILYGNQSNPYKFMKNADVFLLSSYHEAAPMVFDEAKTLNLPIIASNTSSVQEMIIQDEAGWIYNDNINLLSILENLIEDPTELVKVKKKLREKKNNNDTAMSQFEQLIKGDK